MPRPRDSRGQRLQLCRSGQLQDEKNPEKETTEEEIGSGKSPRRETITPGLKINSILSPVGPGALSLWDRVSKQHFLVDSGANISVFPATKSQRASPPSGHLLAANGTSIPVFGTKTLVLRLPGLKAKHQFLLASVHKPILGADFFIANNLVIDLPRGKLLRVEDGLGLELQAGTSPVPASVCGLHLPRANEVESLLDSFPEILVSKFGDSKTPPKHGVHHTIPTTGPPIHSRFRRLMGEKLEVAKKEFQNMLDLGS